MDDISLVKLPLDDCHWTLPMREVNTGLGMSWTARHQAVAPASHDDAIEWKHFPRYWPFVRGIHRSPGNSPHKGQWRGALMFSLICTWINGWVNNREAGDLRRHRAHYDVIVMCWPKSMSIQDVTRPHWVNPQPLKPDDHNIFKSNSLDGNVFIWWPYLMWLHYSDVIMSAMASQITCVSIIYLTVCSGADQRKHQSSGSLAFGRESAGDWWITPTKGQ